jgi:hypothetical protein
MQANGIKQKKERRVYPRLQSYFPFAYRVLDEQKSIESQQERREKAECAMAFDLSPGGMSFVKSGSLKAGKIAQLYFKFPNRHELLKAFTKVAWNDGTFGGLKFILITEEDRNRIKSYLEKITSA